jgi:SAM-dependent methyltransferase
MNCPICSEAASWPIAHRQDRQVEAWRAECGDHSEYRWQLCRQCGNAYPTRQPDRRVLARIWEVNRAVDDSDPKARVEIWEHRRAISRAGALRSHELFAPLAGAPGAFPDIACGLGETVRLFAEHGWQAEGVDADPTMAELHREIGITTRIGQFEDVAIGGGYRVIHVAHAIYFITDPLAFMRQVHGRLAPGGLFAVVIADFMANADPGIPTYAHSFFPTGSSMRYALAVAGFETVMIKKRSGSIYLAARPARSPAIPVVWPAAIRCGYRTKGLRYAAIGRPYLALRRLAKRLVRRG